VFLQIKTGPKSYNKAKKASAVKKKKKKEKPQLSLPLVTYLGMILKGQTCSLSHEQINPILLPPTPQTIKQLKAFLGVTGFCRIRIPRYAALARTLFMLLLILLFGP
jgi:hypothetical protein